MKRLGIWTSILALAFTVLANVVEGGPFPVGWLVAQMLMAWGFGMLFGAVVANRRL